MKRVSIALAAVVFACGVACGQQQGLNYEHLKSYDQLIGQWVHDGELLEAGPDFPIGSKFALKFTFRWILNKNVVEMNWTADLGKTKFTGKTLIGWDAAEQTIIDGGMNSLGGYGLSTVTYDPATKTWTGEGTGVDGEGRKTTATGILTLTDDDTLVWQAKNRTGGDMTGDSPKYTFKRVKKAQRKRQPKAVKVKKVDE